MHLLRNWMNTNIKVTENGINFFVESVEQHKELKTFCIKNNCKFYSHQLREEQKTKFVIYGLHEMDLTELKSDLLSLKIDACDIKKIRTCYWSIHFLGCKSA